MSFDRLQDRIDSMGNPSVVGLDPALEHIPPGILQRHFASGGETLEAAAAAVYEWGAGLIDALCDIVPAVKPQMAYYEALGPEGMRTLKKTCDYARARGMYAILDGKRNDIGSTAEAYSRAFLGAVMVGAAELRPFDADALTVNAYLGSDGIKPFIDTAVKYDKAVFALVKTSNPSAGELQGAIIGGGGRHNTQPPSMEGGIGGTLSGGNGGGTGNGGDDLTVYTLIGDLMEEISRDTIGKHGYTRVGAVVGATYPEESEFLRTRLRHTFFLVPGYGAQGGSAAEAARAFDKDGRGAIVNSSRGIIAAWRKTGADYAAAARAEALRMRDELRREVF